jgi:AraC-like DNA-binding protein
MTRRHAPRRDDVRVLRPAHEPGLELMRASFFGQRFARHSHEGFGVGVIETGALGFRYRGEELVAPAGAVNTVNPDEPHDGYGAGGCGAGGHGAPGWTYRMFYFPAAFLARMAEDVAGAPTPLPFLNSGGGRDPELAALLLRAHALHLDHAAAPGQRLGRDSALLAAFARLITRHTYAPPNLPRARPEHHAVARIKERLRERLDEDLPLAELARMACLSPWHLVRVFARHTGLTPPAWLMQQRARAAPHLLLRGTPNAEAAARSGFADQSHLTRIMKRLTGLTPGQLRNSVQES